MTSPKTTRFTLKEGQKFTTCTPSSSSCTGTTNTTSRSQDGELEITYGSDGRPDNATFYYPSKAECIDSFDPVRNCDLEATFEGKELQELRDSNTELAKYWPNNTEEKQQVNTKFNTDIPDRGANNPPLLSGEDANWFGLPYMLFAIPVIAIVIFEGIRGHRSFIASLGTKGKNTIHKRQDNLKTEQAASLSITDGYLATEPAPAKADLGIRRNENIIFQEIEKLSNRVDMLEQEVTSLKLRGYRSTDSPDTAY